MNYPPIYRRLLRRHIGQYLRLHACLPPKTVGGPAWDAGGPLVGSVEVSLAASTRTRSLTLNAPDDCAYICNMAVDERFRRRGYGAALLDAAERVARLGGQRDLYLHLRTQDVPARRLYEGAGYEQVARDSFLIALVGMDRRCLLRKRLAPTS
ncbi:hypothetical protein WJX81_002285 [Elliptochloris bilobata]|uniref:N-acetyltransferase domain-containing protein n=1 Tax=Elliptochloris bilobata TaxID=381761 RepID=A0AAW1RWX5_9CHLO